MKGWLKAGLIGGIAGSVLTVPALLLFYLPVNAGLIINTCAGALFLLLYPGVGVLAAYWSTIPRTPKQGAIDGALAGFVAFGLDSLATLVLMLIPLLTGRYQQYLLQFVPWASSDALEIATISSMIMLPISLCMNVLVGILFSSLGGLVFASVRKE